MPTMYHQQLSLLSYNHSPSPPTIDLKAFRIYLSPMVKRIEEIECGVCRRHVSSVVNEMLNEASNHQPPGEHSRHRILLSKGAALIGVKDNNESRGGGYFEFRPVVDGKIVTSMLKQGGGALELFQTVWRAFRDRELQSRSNPVHEVALGDLDRILRNPVIDRSVPKPVSDVSSSTLDSSYPLEIDHPRTNTTTTTDSRVGVPSKDCSFVKTSHPNDANLVNLFDQSAMKETGSVGAPPYSSDSPQRKISMKTTTTSDFSASSTPTFASMCPQEDVSILTALTKLNMQRIGPNQCNVGSSNELLLFKAEASLEKGYRRLQENFEALQCNVMEFDKNGKSDFNPAFSQLQTTCEGSILVVLQDMTSTLHTLSLLAGIGLLADGRDPAAEAQKWVAMAWSEYESCLSTLFEMVMSIQQAKLRSAGMFRPIFLSLNQQLHVLSVVNSKKVAVEGLYSMISDILRTPHVRSLFVKLDHLHMQWDSTLHNDSMYSMDDRAHTLLLMRVEVVDSGLQLYLTGQDVLNYDIAAESKLSTYISDWEKRLEKIKDDLLEHSSIALAPDVYSQGPTMRHLISEAEKLFKEEWDKDNEAREFKQTVTQSEVAETVEKITQLRHRAVGLNKREQKQDKGNKKNLQQASLLNLDHDSAIHTQLMLEQERQEETARELEHTSNGIELYLAHQNHIKIKYSMLIFLTSVLYRRFQYLRTFSGIIHGLILARSTQEDLLCGDRGMGEKRLAILAISTLIEEVHQAATRWFAKQAARQLIEDEEQEETRRRKKGVSEARRKVEKLKANATYRKEQQHQQDMNSTSLVDCSTTLSNSDTTSSPPPTEVSLADIPIPHSNESSSHHLDKKQVQTCSQYPVRVDSEGWEVMEEENEHEGFVNILSRFQKVKARRGERGQKEKERHDKDKSNRTISSSIVKPPSSNSSSLLLKVRAGEGDSDPCHVKQLSKENRGVRKTHNVITQSHGLHKEDRRSVRGAVPRDLPPSVNGRIEAGTSMPSTHITTTGTLMHKDSSTNCKTSTMVKEIFGDGVNTSKEGKPCHLQSSVTCVDGGVKERMSPKDSRNRGVTVLCKDIAGTEAAHITSTSTIVEPEKRALTPPRPEIVVEGMTSKPSPDRTVKLNPATGTDVQQKMEAEMCGGGASSVSSCEPKREEPGTPLNFSNGEEDLPGGMCIQFGTVELLGGDSLTSNNNRNTCDQVRPVEEHMEKEVGDQLEELGSNSGCRDRKNRDEHGERLEHTKERLDDRREDLIGTTTTIPESMSKLKQNKQNPETDISTIQTTAALVVDEVAAVEVEGDVVVDGPVSDTTVHQATSLQHSYPTCVTDNSNFTTVQEGGSGVNQPNVENGGPLHHQQPTIAHQMTTSGIMPANAVVEGGVVGAHGGLQHLSSSPSQPPQLVLPIVTTHTYPGQQLQQPQYVIPAQYQGTPGGYNYHHHVLQYPNVSHMSYVPLVNPPYVACPPGGPYSEMPYELPQGHFPQQGGEMGANHVMMNPSTVQHGGQVWVCSNGAPQWINMSPLGVHQRMPAVANQQAVYMQQLQMSSNGYTRQPSTVGNGSGYHVEHGGKGRKWGRRRK